MEPNARSHFATLPHRFYNWCWTSAGTRPAAKPSELEAMGCLGRGYARTTWFEKSPEIREEFCARMALWFLYTHPESALFWPHIDDATDELFYQAMKDEVARAQQSFLRDEFCFVDRLFGIGRHWPKARIVGLPATLEDLDKVNTQSQGPVLVLIPHFDQTPTPLIQKMCSSLVGPKVQILAAMKSNNG